MMDVTCELPVSNREIEVSDQHLLLQLILI
jgi:hypothetical protein